MATGAATAPGLTEQQRNAVEKRGVSIALSAGAGCGKTHVLVERFLAELTPATLDADDRSSPLSGLVAITFTDRAAREMRDRLRRKCRERLNAADERHAEAWLALLRELETARVSTIHAFCGSLLRAHAVEAGIDPHFQVMQTGQSATLFSEQVDDQLREQLGQMNEDLLDLVVMFGLSPLREMFQNLLGRRHAIDFEKWHGTTPAALVRLWQDVAREEIVPKMREKFWKLAEVATLRKIIDNWSPEHPKLVDRFATLREQFAAIEDGAEFLEAIDRVRGAATVQHVHKRYWHSDETYESFRDAAEQIRDWIAKIKKKLDIDPETATASAAAGLALLRVVRPVIAAYERRKRELGMLDFDDLLEGARQLLTGPHGAALCNRLSRQIKLLLVDEFQDTDPLQVKLVELLCGEQLLGGKLFFVGDAKQSIYRFRGADPQVFRSLRQKIPRAGQLPLTENFRSQPAVLDFVNALFQDSLGSDADERYERLTASRPALATTPAIEFLWATLPSDNTEKPNVERLRGCEADWIARRLAELLASGTVMVPGKNGSAARPAGPGDVAILFRALPDVRFYEEALRRHGIPYYLVGGGAFYAQQEIFDLLNLLRAIDAPADTVSLTGALRSPFFSLTDETLFWLAQNAGGLAAGLFAAKLPKELGQHERRQATHAAETLRYLRAKKDRLPVAALIREALARTGYDALLLAEFLGERKLANLRKLIDQARSFDQSGLFTLSDFIHELGEFIARQPDEPPAPVELETSTVVRLMTIHQAKGLEFPIVVVPDLARGQRGPTSRVAFDSRLGPLVRAVTPGRDAGVCGLDIFRLQQEDEEAAEAIRLLYVATTRAADYLILSAGVEDFDKPAGWLAYVGEHFDLRTGALRVRLPRDYARPEVTVTLTRPPAPSDVDGASRVDWERVAAEARESAAAGRGVVPPLVAPVMPDLLTRRVFSFSRLAGNFTARELTDEEQYPIERLDDSAAGDATELGILVHAVLAQINFATHDAVAARCRHEITRRSETATVEPATATAMIERFLRSPRADELRAATVVHRELEFLLRWPPGEAGDGRMLQGFIDCLYQDRAGRWHVLDYKTNRVPAAAVPGVAASYELQMSLYALAAEEVLGVSPASLVLSFLQPGVEHTIPWNAAARDHLIEQVNEALAKAALPG